MVENKGNTEVQNEGHFLPRSKKEPLFSQTHYIVAWPKQAYHE